MSQNKLFVCESFLVGYWSEKGQYFLMMGDEPFTGVSINDAYYSFKTISYYKNGLRHREDGPAVITFYTLVDDGRVKKEYHLNGKEVKITGKIRKCIKIKVR